MASHLATATDSFVPLRLSSRSWALQALAVLLGTAVLAASSWIEVPMYPVPMTMQTYAVLIIGALYGWRLGALTVLTYLGEAAIGLPVLAGGAFGAVHFVGPTGGYLFGFVLAAALVGWLAERGWTARGLLASLAVMLLGHAAIFVPGIAWLSTLIGFEQAVVYGLLPFLLGTLLKSALATATVEGARRILKRAQ